MPGKHVGLPVQQVGVGVSALRDQADVFGHIRVGRARPLAIHNFVEVVRVAERPSVSRPPSFYTRFEHLGEINIRSVTEVLVPSRLEFRARLSRANVASPLRPAHVKH